MRIILFVGVSVLGLLIYSCSYNPNAGLYSIDKESLETALSDMIMSQVKDDQTGMGALGASFGLTMIEGMVKTAEMFISIDQDSLHIISKMMGDIDVVSFHYKSYLDSLSNIEDDGVAFEFEGDILRIIVGEMGIVAFNKTTDPDDVRKSHDIIKRVQLNNSAEKVAQLSEEEQREADRYTQEVLRNAATLSGQDSDITADEYNQTNAEDLFSQAKIAYKDKKYSTALIKLKEIKRDFPDSGPAKSVDGIIKRIESELENN